MDYKYLFDLVQRNICSNGVNSENGSICHKGIYWSIGYDAGITIRSNSFLFFYEKVNDRFCIDNFRNEVRSKESKDRATKMLSKVYEFLISGKSGKFDDNLNDNFWLEKFKIDYPADHIYK